jgi:hypothetical protein
LVAEYLHLPRHHEIPAEEFCPDAWNKVVEIAGGEDRIDPIRERYYGDAFIINFGSAEKAVPEVEYRPQDRKGWHTDLIGTVASSTQLATQIPLKKVSFTKPRNSRLSNTPYFPLLIMFVCPVDVA